MRILGIALEGVGKFGVPMEITGFGPGLNILSDGNEAGKSTIFKAIRACFFERHNTTNRDVKALATEGLSLPVSVVLDFEQDGARYRLKKSFLKSPSAELQRDGTTLARNREADETCWELLGMKAGSGRSIDEAAFGLLWVGQGKSFLVPEPSEQATSALNQAIQVEVGELVGGERARTLLRSLDDDLNTLITPTGKPKKSGAYDDALSHLGSTQQELETAERKLAEMDTYIAELALRRQEREKLNDPLDASRIEKDLSETRANLQAGEAARRNLTNASTEEELAGSRYAEAQKRLKDILERAERLDKRRAAVGEIAARIGPLDERRLAEEQKLKAAKETVNQIDVDASGREGRLTSLGRIDRAVERAAKRPDLQTTIEKLQALSESIVTADAELNTNSATASVVDELRRIEQDIEILEAKRATAAARIEVVLGAAGVGKVWVGDDELTEDRTFVATDPLTVRVGELATLHVTPPTGARSEADSAQLQGELAQLLADAGVKTRPELLAARARRERAEADRDGLENQAKALGQRTQELSAALASAGREIAEMDAAAAAVMVEEQLKELPTREAVNQEKMALEAQRGEATQKRQAQEGVIEACNHILKGIGEEIAAAKATEREIAGAIESDLAALPDAERDARIALARQRLQEDQANHEKKKAALESLAGKCPEETELEGLRIQVSRLEEAGGNRSRKIAELEKSVSNLEGRIGSGGGDGIGETAAELRDQMEMAGREVGRQERRVHALQLLRETVSRCYDEQRERLNAPLLRHLGPFLHDVFPSAELTLGDGFSVTGLRRTGLGAEDFERLSDGTREQIAVLVRLAMGAMLHDRGNEVPIILDDALVFSDDLRIERMFNALNRAAKNQQVIVFTCRSRTFERLGGQTLSIAAATV